MAQQSFNDSIKKEGLLEKQSRYLKIWRKRWTVLNTTPRGQHYLSTYKKQKQYVAPTESVRIDEHTDVAIHTDDKDYTKIMFYIENRGDKEKFLFRTNSTHDRDEWIRSITKTHKPSATPQTANGDAGSTRTIEPEQKQELINNNQASVEADNKQEVVEEPNTIQTDADKDAIIPNTLSSIPASAPARMNPSILSAPAPVPVPDVELAAAPDNIPVITEPAPTQTAETADTAAILPDTSDQDDADAEDNGENTNEDEDEPDPVPEPKPTDSLLRIYQKEDPDFNHEDEAEAHDNIGSIHNLQKQISSVTEEDSASQASSLLSDGEAPFGNRWGDGFDTVEESDAADMPLDKAPELADEVHDEKEVELDTSSMAYASVVMIGSSLSGKTLMFNQLSNVVDDDDCKYKESQYDSMAHKVFHSKDVEDKDQSMVCSFMDTSKNVNSTIRSIACCEVTIMMVNVSLNKDILDEFKQYIRILNTFGVTRVIVCVSHMDVVEYSEQAFEESREQLKKIIKKCYMKPKKFIFIPVNSKDGENVRHVSVNDKLSWYNGWSVKLKKEQHNGYTVVDALRTLTLLPLYGEDEEKQAMLCPISYVLPQDNNQYVVSGKIEQGTLSVQDNLRILCANNTIVPVSLVNPNGLQRNGQSMESGKQGDYVSIQLNVDNDVVPSIGDVLCCVDDDVSDCVSCNSIKALVEVCNVDQMSVQDTIGYLCVRSGRAQCELTNIVWKKAVEGKKDKDATFVTDKDSAEVELTLRDALMMSVFEKCECLGRFVVIEDGKPVMLGKVIGMN